MKKTRNLIIICAFIMLLCMSGCTKDGYVASKVTVGGIDIGGMSRDEAMSLIGANIIAPESTAELAIGDETLVVTASEVGARYNTERTIDYAIEKSSGFFSGLFRKNYPMQVDVDEQKLEDVIKTVERGVVQTSGVVSDTGIVITNGTSGKMLDRAVIKDAVATLLGGGEFEGEAEYIVTAPEKVDEKAFLSAFAAEYKEAEYIRDENGEISVTEESAGVEFDMSKAVEEMKKHTEEGECYTIECVVKLPEKTKLELEEKLFADTLGTYSTNFSSSSANRASNISLATSSIDGTILMPGEVFSFNDTVGERTTSRGYKSAGAYVAGETVDQVGGGICQVSSTLYNSVLLSNIEIVSRRSHQMTVSYVPMGRDATVNWGTTDFKFKNNTEYPIKITGTINGRNVTISVVGTATIENMEVKIETSTVSVLEPAVEIVEDAEKEVGYTHTKQGSKGYVVDAVRVVYSNGAEITREKLTRSRYNPKKTVTTVGTKVVEIPTAPVEDYVMPPGIIPVETPTV